MGTIDLNCDLGEGGAHDEALLDWVTSANIACGGHAGDAATMRHVVIAARSRGVAVGAHPGYDDREQFGRRELAHGSEEIVALVYRQVTALKRIAEEEGVALRHVKPHGALYNRAARDTWTAEAIATAVANVDPRLILVGLAGSELVRAARAAGLQAASEAFADRTYLRDGTLAPRTRRDAVLTDPRAVAEQVLDLVLRGTIGTVDGAELVVTADTICLHSDTADAVGLAKTVRAALRDHGIAVRSLG